jgi:hypothetical protein
MKCSSAKIEIDKADDGRSVVKLIVGNKPERVGEHFAVNQVAWVEMSPGMARSIAADLLEVASEIERGVETG